MSENEITVKLKRMAGYDIAAYSEDDDATLRMYVDGEPATEGRFLEAVSEVAGFTVGRIKTPRKPKAGGRPKGSRNKPKADPPAEPPAQ